MVSFVVMILFAVTDLVTGYFGIDLTIKEYIYTSFLILTLGSFGISSFDKYNNMRRGKYNNDEYENYSNESQYD